MIGQFRGGVVPDANVSEEMAAAFEGAAERIRERFDAVALTAALEEVWQLVRALNRYVQDEAPWKLAKDESSGGRLEEVLYTLAEGLRVVSVLLHPYMPESTAKLLTALGRDEVSLDGARLGAAGGGVTVGELPQLFPRVERPE